jgi:carbon storage regulator CsrA
MNYEMRGTSSAEHQGQPIAVGSQPGSYPIPKATGPDPQRTDNLGITSLILTRREGEAVIVDDGRVIVRVSAIKGKKVRLQFLAPAHLRIFREEISDSRCGLGDSPRSGGDQC